MSDECDDQSLSSVMSTTRIDDVMGTELQYTPVPYIALIGLNASSNVIHTNIWNTFTQNRQSDRCPLYFKLITDKYLFLPSKQKVNIN
jgi:hypothetical protein